MTETAAPGDWLGLAGRVALVTGAGSGIGRAAAIALAGAGAQVVAVDKDEAGVQATAGITAQAGGGALQARVLDVTDAAAWAQLGEAIGAEFGRLDILVNAAGIALGDRAGGSDLDVYRRTFAVNVEGTLLGMAMALHFMEKAGRGAIVNVSSTAAFSANPTMASYGASKAAVAHFSSSAALRLARAGGTIRVNTVHPGLVATPMAHALHDVLSQTMPMPFDQMVTRITTGRLGKPEEIADTILFLVSDRASFISGASIAADLAQSA